MSEKYTFDKVWIKRAAKASRLPRFIAKRKLEKAFDMGVRPGQYIRHKCWEMSDAEIAELGASFERHREMRARQRAELAEATGWPDDECAKKIAEAHDAGIIFSTYMGRKGYELDSDELKRLAKALEAVHRRKSDDYQYLLDQIVARSGWTRSAVESHMEYCREELGINRFHYFYDCCWSLDPEQLEEHAAIFRALHDGSEGKREKCFAFIKENTGWPDGRVNLELLEARARSGCTFEDYARCHMWGIEPETQCDYLNSEIFRKFRMAYNDFSVGTPIFSYKDAFEERFTNLIKRGHFALSGIGFDGFCKAIEGWTHLVAKPVRGTYGKGIEIFPCNESADKNRELYDKLVEDGQDLVIEQKIEQCEQLAKLCPSSVNTLRVVTLLHGGQVDILQCVLRVGVGAVVDNIHAGGLVVEVDKETGVCLGQAVDYLGNLVKSHPLTGVEFKGVAIPNWDSVIELARKAALVVPECGLVGWDIAVTPYGADLVEGNIKADYDAGQMAHLGVRHEGLRDSVVAPYVHPSLLGHSYLEDMDRDEADAAAAAEAPFKFSVVMPIYNAEAYLDESVQSILGQSIGFEENVQLVLVNDGSTDRSGDICRRYQAQHPGNIVYVEKANGGLSSARNAGLDVATGAWVNFLDPDDFWERDALENAWRLASKHPGEVDIIAGRLKFFEGKTGYHQLDYKFKDGSRIVDINKHPDYVQMSAASAFFASTCFKGRRFDEKITIGEDAQLITPIILEKQRYGLAKNAVYHYRKRDEGTSLTQQRSENKSAYLDTIDRYYGFIAEYSEKMFGRVVPYVQHCLVNGLKYRAGKPLPDCLDAEEGRYYRDRVIELLGQVYDGVLLDARNATPSLRLYMLRLKRAADSYSFAHVKDGKVWVNGGVAFAISGRNDIRLDKLKEGEDGCLSVMGEVRVPSFVEDYNPYIAVGEHVFPVEFADGVPNDKVGITGEVIYASVRFCTNIPSEKVDGTLSAFAEYDGDMVCVPLSFGKKGGLASIRKHPVKVGAWSFEVADKYALSILEA